MTNRERINATVRCEPSDRPPLIEWLGFTPWAQTLDRWRSESGVADLDVARYFGLDRGFLRAPVELGSWPHFDHEILSDGEEEQVYRDWRGPTLRNRKDGNTLPDYVANPVSDRADWERYKAERISPDPAGRTAEVVRFAAGGYIAGLDRAIPPDVPWASFRSFLIELKGIAGL